MTTPFDFVKDLSSEKQNIYSNNKEEYIPFLINRAFSYYPDTIFFAEEMNQKPNLEHKPQHDFYLYGVSKRKRFSKWAKSTPHADVLLVSEIYKYSIEKSKQVLPLFSSEQLEVLRGILQTGGVKPKNDKAFDKNT